MPIIGLNFTAVQATRSNKPVSGEIKVNSTPTITAVKEITMRSLKDKAITMEFEFATDYQPDIGEIKLGGNIVFIADNNKDVLDQWGKEKTLPEDVSVEILNHLFRRCLVKIATLAEDLQLPPPLDIPRVVKKAAAEKAR
ncbi:MAG: hypothetical protein HY520_02170 [Candidatus Aenigmarchaeota archaeon]|nr:hypothetical protein [Candidatus Aenigmarchaeota archaeon]